MARSTRRSCSRCRASATPTTSGPSGSTPVHHLPGVGEHLQDHLEVYVQHASTQPVSLNPLMKWRNRPWIGLQWLCAPRTGRVATTSKAAASCAATTTSRYPNLMFHFLPIAVRYDGSAPAGGHGYQVHVGPMYSDARGSVRITSPDVHVKPALRFNYLSTEQDRREWVEAIRAARHILGQPAFAGSTAASSRPARACRPSEQILDWVAQRRRDRAAPVVHVPDGHRRDVGDRPAIDRCPRRGRASAWSTPRRCRTSPTATSTPR